MSACVYCHKDKGKRSCPALGGLISAKCCGQHRGIEINCPVTCHYFREGEEHARSRLAPQFHRSWAEAVMPLYRDRRAQLIDWIVYLEVSIYSYFAQYSRGIDADVVEALEFLKSKLSPIAIVETAGSSLGKHLDKAMRTAFESGSSIDTEEGQEGIDLLIEIINQQLDKESQRHALHGLLGHVEQYIGAPEMPNEPDEDSAVDKPKIYVPGRD